MRGGINILDIGISAALDVYKLSHNKHLQKAAERQVGGPFSYSPDQSMTHPLGPIELIESLK